MFTSAAPSTTLSGGQCLRNKDHHGGWHGRRGESVCVEKCHPMLKSSNPLPNISKELRLKRQTWWFFDTSEYYEITHTPTSWKQGESFLESLKNHVSANHAARCCACISIPWQWSRKDEAGSWNWTEKHTILTSLKLRLLFHVFSGWAPYVYYKPILDSFVVCYSISRAYASRVSSNDWFGSP